jgi:hypothetical protein
VKVFVSYSSHDGAVAEQIIRHLRRAGFDVLMSDERLTPGVHWGYEVLRAIRSSDAIVALLSAASLDSEHASLERSAALASPEKALIPVVLEKGLDLPFFIKDIQYLDLSDPRSWPAGLDSLVEALRSFHGREKRPDKEVRRALDEQRLVLEESRTLQAVKLEVRESVFNMAFKVFAFVAAVITSLLANIVVQEASWPMVVWSIIALLSGLILMAISRDLLLGFGRSYVRALSRRHSHLRRRRRSHSRRINQRSKDD